MFRSFLRIAAASVLAVGAMVELAGAGLAATPTDFSAIDSFVSSQMTDAHLPGVAIGIVEGGQVVHVQGFGQSDPSGHKVSGDTPFVIGSLSKSFTALAVMQLVETGKVDLDAPAQTYVPAFRLDSSSSSRITVRQLLNQTSGIPTQAGIDPLSSATTTLDDQVRRLSSVRPAAEPGAAYAYSNSNYLVLGRLIELVSGESYGDYLTAHVLGPLGMSNTFTSAAPAEASGLAGGTELWFGLQQRLAPGTGFRPDFVPAGFVMSSASDMARYVAAQLDGGSYSGVGVLTSADVDLMHTAATSGLLSAQGGGYGMGWFVGPRGQLPHTVWHNGSAAASHSMVLMVPDRGLGIVVLTNAESLVYEMLGRVDLIADGIAARLLGAPQPGTLSSLYTAFDIVAALIAALQVRAMIRLVRRPAGIPQHRGRVRTALLEMVVPLWRELVAPVAILIELPNIFSAPWSNIARTDLGAWALGMASLLLATGFVRAYRTRSAWTPLLARVAPKLARSWHLATARA